MGRSPLPEGSRDIEIGREGRASRDLADDMAAGLVGQEDGQTGAGEGIGRDDEDTQV